MTTPPAPGIFSRRFAAVRAMNAVPSISGISSSLWREMAPLAKGLTHPAPEPRLKNLRARIAAEEAQRPQPYSPPSRRWVQCVLATVLAVAGLIVVSAGSVFAERALQGQPSEAIPDLNARYTPAVIGPPAPGEWLPPGAQAHLQTSLKALPAHQTSVKAPPGSHPEPGR